MAEALRRQRACDQLAEAHADDCEFVAWVKAGKPGPITATMVAGGTAMPLAPPDLSGVAMGGRPPRIESGSLPRPQCLTPGCTKPAMQDTNHGPYRRNCDEHEPPAVDHPPPWRWRDGMLGGQDLVDANGGIVMDDRALPLSPRVHELVRAAPEMEALLRKALDLVAWLTPFAFAGAPPGSNLPTKVEVAEAVVGGRELLDRIDKAGR